VSSPARDQKGRVAPGHSLNPRGRPKGALGEAGRIRQALAEELPEILEAVIERAKDGDMQAARLILERVLPPLRPEAKFAAMPELALAETLTDKALAILDGIARQDMGPETGVQLLAALGGLARILEVDELAVRIAAIETAQQRRGRGG
jgi:hypothetical protein